MNSFASPKSANLLKTDTCLVGALETWPLTDIIMWLHQTQRTAMVRVGSGLTAGLLFFRKGNLFRCEWGTLAGEDALLSLLGLGSGTFTLIQREPPDARCNVHRPTPELLLLCTIAQDERARTHVA